jgi:hypothetical protein
VRLRLVGGLRLEVGGEMLRLVRLESKALPGAIHFLTFTPQAKRSSDLQRSRTADVWLMVWKAKRLEEKDRRQIEQLRFSF